MGTEQFMMMEGKIVSAFFVCIFILHNQHVFASFRGYPPCPSFMVGVGHGGTDEYVGPFTYRKCIQHCTDMRKNDKSVNGVTMPLHGTGCFCEHNMTSIGKAAHYKTCYLKDMVTLSLNIVLSDALDAFPFGSCLIVKLKDSKGKTKHHKLKRFWAAQSVPKNFVSRGITFEFKFSKDAFKVGFTAEALLKIVCPHGWWRAKPEDGDFVHMGTGVVTKNAEGNVIVNLKMQKF